MLFIFITPSHKSTKNHSFKIISSKLMLLRSMVFMSISSLKNVTISESYNQGLHHHYRIKHQLSLAFYSKQANQKYILMLTEKHRQLYTYFLSVISIEAIFFGNNFITYFLSDILIRKILCCRRINISSFIQLFSNKNCFISFFFLIFCHALIQPSSWMPCYRH